MPSKLRKLKEKSHVKLNGQEAWDAAPEQGKKMHDYLCGNHSRNLPVAAFNRLFETHMKLNHGEALKATINKFGGHARLEPSSGPPLLRSTCKPRHDGFGAHHEGDGPEVRLWLEENYPALGDAKTGRA